MLAAADVVENILSGGFNMQLLTAYLFEFFGTQIKQNEINQCKKRLKLELECIKSKDIILKEELCRNLTQGTRFKPGSTKSFTGWFLSM